MGAGCLHILLAWAYSTTIPFLFAYSRIFSLFISFLSAFPSLHLSVGKEAEASLELLLLNPCPGLPHAMAVCPRATGTCLLEAANTSLLGHSDLPRDWGYAVVSAATPMVTG